MFSKVWQACRKLILRNRVLTVILILAAILRIAGVYPGYHPYHSDEGMSYSSAIAMIKNLNFDPTRYDYPSLIPLINAVVFSFLLIPLFIIISFIFNPSLIPSFSDPLNLWQKFIIVNQQTLVLFWGRFITALFGVGVVLMVYLVTIKLFQNKKIGLVASLLTAVNFRQVLNSHLSLPDIYNAFFLLLAFYFIFKILETPSWKNYLLSGLALALSISTKSQIFAFPTLFLVHSLKVLQTKDERSKLLLIKSFFSAKFFSALLLGFLIVVLLNIYHILNWQEFIEVNIYTASKYGFGVKSLNFYPISYLYHIGIGQVISFYIIGGLILGLKKYTSKSLLLLSMIIPFFYVFFYYSYGGFYTRNFVTITPLLLIFAGLFIVEFSQLMKKEWMIILVMLGLVSLGSFNQIKNSLINVYYFSKPWNLSLANSWAKTNIPNGATVVTHPWDKYPTDKNFKIIPLEMNKIFSLSEMREENVDYAYLNIDWLTMSSVWWMNRSTEESLKYWNKPDKISANTYSSVATAELASFSAAHFIKPWQSPDMNFIIVKVPDLPILKEKKLIKNFEFLDKSDLANWKIITGENNDSHLQISYDPSVGNFKKGAINIKPGSQLIPIIRTVSPIISINDNKAYQVEGWISTDKELSKEKRDGYLRIDFYQELPVINIKTKSMATTVSSRYYGNNWQKKEIKVIPPQGAKFMTVSGDVIGDSGRDFWFDDIKIFESEENFSDPRQILPYTDYHIPSEILFPYSQANT